MKQVWAAVAAMAFVAVAAAQGEADGHALRDKGVAGELWKQEHALERAGKFQQAIDVCQQIARQDPTQNATALSTIAALQGRQGHYAEEIDWAQRALAADPKFFQAEINLGTAQAQLGHLDLAQAAYERARALAPRSPLPLYSLGTLAEIRRDVAGATALYKQSVAVDPKFESGWFNLAAMQARAGRFDDALASLDKVLALNPKADDAKAMRRHVEADKAATKH